MREYDQIASWYSATRDPEIGVAPGTAFADALPPSATVLDVGCGDGIPISQLLSRRGCRLVGLDSSPVMLEAYRGNIPEAVTRCEPVENAAFPTNTFDGIVAWGVLFHLSAHNQERALSNMARWLKPGGHLLFTSGDAEGVRTGTMDGVAFRYVSFDAEAYRRLLEGIGVTLTDRYPDPWENHVYVARKSA